MSPKIKTVFRKLLLVFLFFFPFAAKSLICCGFHHIWRQITETPSELLCTPGKNFRLYKYGQHLASANGIGSKNSTFLGMREVSAVATLIHAEVSLIFEEHNAVTTLQLPYVKVLSSIKLAISEPVLSTSELAAPAPAEASISAWEALDFSTIIFFCCDDDKYPCTP